MNLRQYIFEAGPENRISKGKKLGELISLMLLFESLFCNQYIFM